MNPLLLKFVHHNHSATITTTNVNILFVLSMPLCNSMTLKECHERDKDDLSDAETGKVYAPQHVLDTSD